MRKWSDVKKNLKSTSKEEQYILDFMSHLIGAIIAERKKRKISQKELSEMIGAEQSTISRIETWTVRPTLDTVLKIAYALDIDVNISVKC
ncbi:MAG: helix-turn-helix transcriptional regulator [Clostridiales bacterium]